MNRHISFKKLGGEKEKSWAAQKRGGFCCVLFCSDLF